MNITRENIDTLNAVVKVEISKDDYNGKVEKILIDYRKTANIPGFRKGHVPMGMVKKQYGKAVLIDEVNKLLQDALGKYLAEEKLNRTKLNTSEISIRQQLILNKLRKGSYTYDEILSYLKLES